MREQSTLGSWLQLSLQPGVKCHKRRFGTKPRVYLGGELPGIYFTKREAECAYCLMFFMKRSEIATRLALSRRTIDSYIESAKKKLQCRSHDALLAVLRKTDFMKNVEEVIGSIIL